MTFKIEVTTNNYSENHETLPSCKTTSLCITAAAATKKPTY